MVARIVIIDDSPSALAAVAGAIGPIIGHDLLTFENPRSALVYLKANDADLILVDQTMPFMTGTELIRVLREHPAHRQVPIVMITSDNDRQTRVDAIEAGATEFLHKPFDATELRARVKNLLALRLAQRALADRAKGLEADVETAIGQMRVREEEIIWRLTRAMAYRDGDTGEHIDRVAGIARLVAQELGLPDDRCRMIYLATPLHDVGKIGVSDNILKKPARLTLEETAVMRRHVEIGMRILAGSECELIRVAERIVSGHHERWDGTGYPNGVAGADIPLEARIVAVADVFDALCSERPYKSAWSIDDAFSEIVRGSGSHFDPACVRAFVSRCAEVLEIVSPPQSTTNSACADSRGMIL